jgi:hypothetical protein
MRFQRVCTIPAQRLRNKASPFQHAANDGLLLQIAERYCNLYRPGVPDFPSARELLEANLERTPCVLFPALPCSFDRALPITCVYSLILISRDNSHAS